MEQTTAFSGLLDLINFIGSFVVTPIWFGISFLQLLAISFLVYYVIGILLGGIAPLPSIFKHEISFTSNKDTSNKHK